jgi:hypothetical protein
MIRELRASDIPALKAMHKAQGHPYPFPDLAAGDFVDALVTVDENDVPVQAVACRKTVEVYFLADPAWKTPGWRMETLRALHLAAHERLLLMGYRDAQAFIPPRVERAFGRRLSRIFGWVKGSWTCYTKYL